MLHIYVIDYTNVKRKPLEFQVGDRVMLKVSPWKGVIRFGKCGKLSPRYIGPFKILARIGSMAYKLELPQELSGIHNTFHVSNLKKHLSDENLVIPLDEIKLDDKLHFIEEPVEIMDREVKQLKQSRIPIVKLSSSFSPLSSLEARDFLTYLTLSLCSHRYHLYCHRYWLSFRAKMTNETNVTAPGNVTSAPVTNTVANHAEKPEKFNGQNFKRWQQKMFLKETTPQLEPPKEGQPSNA
ncbi:hypothetical protein Tco_0790474 [Tanacetum coccineum]